MQIRKEGSVLNAGFKINHLVNRCFLSKTHRAFTVSTGFEVLAGAITHEASLRGRDLLRLYNVLSVAPVGQSTALCVSFRDYVFMPETCALNVSQGDA